jgi:hypothetical protein
VAFGTEACKRCHQFEFPEHPGARAEPKFKLMQRTWSEHHDNNWQKKDCADCHMPRRADGGHAFVGGYDEALLKASLAVEGSFSSATDYVLTLSPQDVTHAVPTGDLFRRLRVDIELLAGKRRVKRCTQFLARHFGKNQKGEPIEVSDDRVHMVDSQVRCSSAMSSDSARYRVTYERVAHHNGSDEGKATVESSVTLARGTSSASRSMPIANSRVEAGPGL